MKVARLAVLVVALTAGAGAAWLMSGSGPAPSPQAPTAAQPVQVSTDDVLVASHPLALGTVVAAADIAWQTWPKSAVGTGMLARSEQPKAAEDVVGSVVRGDFVQGEPLRREKLVKGANAGFLSAILPSGMRAVSITTDTSGSSTAGGFILPNDRVDVIRTYRDDQSTKVSGSDVFISETVLSNIRVLAIGPNVQERNGQPNVTGVNATLEVDPRQAEVLVLAQRVGPLSLVLRSMADASQGSNAVSTDTNPDKGLTVVRYGVAAQVTK